MKIRILGAAAGGGLPQWNCRCPNCVLARTDSPDISPSSQSSVAISSDDSDWFLLNVSPDVRKQVMDFPALTPPGDDPRATGIAGCVLTDAEIDHTSGLLFLREGTLFQIYSTPIVRQWLKNEFPVEPMLSAFIPRPWEDLSFDTPAHLKSSEGRESTLHVTSIDLAPHPPLYVKDQDADASGSCIALLIEDRATGGKFLYAPGVEAMTDELDVAAREADVVFFDGTFWTRDEMIDLGLAKRNALDMGHWPITGEDGGSLDWFKALPVKTKVFFHINNTNPMLNRTSPEHAILEEAGISVGRDGDTFEI
jgi:pyrroloquinoline quinone biosynthesis protein B